MKVSFSLLLVMILNYSLVANTVFVHEEENIGTKTKKFEAYKEDLPFNSRHTGSRKLKDLVNLVNENTSVEIRLEMKDANIIIPKFRRATYEEFFRVIKDTYHKNGRGVSVVEISKNIVLLKEVKPAIVKVDPAKRPDELAKIKIKDLDVKPIVEDIQDAISMTKARDQIDDQDRKTAKDKAKIEKMTEEFENSRKNKRSWFNYKAWTRGRKIHDLKVEDFDQKQQEFLKYVFNENEKLRQELIDERNKDNKNLAGDGNLGRKLKKISQDTLVTEQAVHDEVKGVRSDLKEYDKNTKSNLEAIASTVYRNQKTIDQLKTKRKFYNKDLGLLRPVVKASYSGTENLLYQVNVTFPSKVFSQVTFKQLYLMPYDDLDQPILKAPYTPDTWREFTVEGRETADKVFQTKFKFGYAVKKIDIALIGVDALGVKVVIDGTLNVLYDNSLSSRRIEMIGRYFVEVKKNYKKAAMAFLKAIEFDPNNPDIRYNLGYIYYQRKMYKQAEYHFGKGVSIFPNDGDMKMAYGWAKLERGARLITEGSGMPDNSFGNEMIYRNLVNKSGFKDNGYKVSYRKERRLD